MKKVKNFIIVVFVVTILTIPRSYPLVRGAALGALLALGLFDLAGRRPIRTSTSLLFFYSVLAFIGCFWCIVGIANDAYVVGINDSFRLYVLWSFLYFVIFTIMLSNDSLALLHRGFIVAGYLIATINYFGLADAYFGWGVVPLSVKNELDLHIGFHEGYVQITTQNIGSLFYIVPYLIALIFRKELNTSKRKSETVLLLILIALSLLTGRRALWVCILITPILVLCIALVGKDMKALRWRTALLAYPIVGLVVIVLLLTLGGGFGPLQHLKNAFSAQDERSIQKGYLLNGFWQQPLLGNGFGVNAGYTRNRAAPWIYELTYHQMLFNTGIVGVSILAATIGAFFFKAIKATTERGASTIFSFGASVGILSFLIAAYSNPYLGSFDFLFILGLIPFIAVHGASPIQNTKLDRVITKEID